MFRILRQEPFVPWGKMAHNKRASFLVRTLGGMFQFTRTMNQMESFLYILTPSHEEEKKKSCVRSKPPECSQEVMIIL